MSAYKTVETKILRPDSAAVDGAAAEGEWINAEPLAVDEVRGLLRQLPAVLAESALGQSGAQAHRWRGPLPEGVTPEPGWEIEIERKRYRVIGAMRSMGRTWRLDCVTAGVTTG